MKLILRPNITRLCYRHGVVRQFPWSANSSPVLWFRIFLMGLSQIGLRPNLFWSSAFSRMTTQCVSSSWTRSYGKSIS